MKREMHTECARCGKTGPEGVSAREALEKAAAEGWQVGRRSKVTDDYCPDCRGTHGRKSCSSPGEEHDALYSLRGLSGTQYACGRHVVALLRESITPQSPEVAVARIASRRPKKGRS